MPNQITVTQPAPIVVQVKQTGKTSVVDPSLQVTTIGAANSFGVVNVATQNNIVASIPTDTLRVEAGSGIALTTNNVTKTLSIVATGGSAFDQFARDQANSAYNQANTANVTGQAAFDHANSAYSNANTAIYTAAQIRANISNTAPVNYDPSTGIISHADSGATATTYGNTTFVPQLTVDAQGHIISIVNTAIALPSGSDQFARDHANGAFGHANGGFLQANTARDHANGAFDKANTANVTGQAAFDRANLGFTLATTANTVAASAYNQANIATTNADAAFTRANNAYANANTAIYTAAQIRANISATAPVNYNSTTGVISLPSTANGQVLIGNTVSSSFDVATLTQGTGIIITNDKGSITIAATGGSAIDQYARDHANGAFDHANGGFLQANTARDHANGAFGHANGGFLQANTARDHANGGFLQANTARDHANGAFGHANGGFLQANTARDHANGAFGHANGGFLQANTARDHANGAFGHANGGFLQANTARDHANGGFLQANTARDHANGAFNKANIATTNADAAFAQANAAYANANTAIYTAAQIRANISATAPVNYNSTTGVISLPSTANGQLLIGNTVSSSFDVATLTQGSGIVITNGKGSITIAASGGSGADQYARNIANNQTAWVYSDITANGVYNDWAELYAAYQAAGSPPATIGFIGGDPPIIPAGTYTFGTPTVFSGLQDSDYGGRIPVNFDTGAKIVGVTCYRGLLLQNQGSQFVQDITIAGVIDLHNTYLLAAAGVELFYSNGGSIILTNSILDANTMNVDTYNGFTIAVRGVGSALYANAFIGGNGTEATKLMIDQAPDSVATFEIQPQQLFNGAIYVIDQPGLVGTTASRPVYPANGQIYYDYTVGGPVVANNGTWKTVNQLLQSTANGQTLIGNTVSGGFDVATLTQGTGIAITNDKGSITIAATGGSAIDQYARDHANGAFDKANTANVTGQAAFDKANIATTNADAAFAQANAAYANANTAIYTAAQIRANISNTTPILYNSTTGVVSLIPATANGQLLIGNTVSSGYDLNVLTQGTGIVITNDKGSITIAATGIDQYARDHANGAFGHANGGFLQANTARDHANGAFGHANGAFSHANGAFDKANIATTNADAAFAQANAAYANANTAIYTAAQIRANISNTHPVSYSATTGVISIVPPTGNGQLLIGNTISGSYDIANLTQGYGIIVTNSNGKITLDAAVGRTYYLVLSELSTIGTYNVAATVPSAGAEVNTSAIFTGTAFSQTAVFATANGSPGTTLLPAGTYGRHFHATTDGVNNIAQLRVELYKYAANGLETLLRTNDSPEFNSGDAEALLLNWNVTDATSHALVDTDRLVFKVFARRVSGGSGSVRVTIFYEGSARASYIPTTILAAGADDFARQQANAAFNHANGAFGHANGAFTWANAAYSNANTAIYTAAQIRANISATTPISYDSGTGIVSHATSGVVATGHGDAATVPKFIVNATGHVTEVTNTAIAISAAAVTSGILAVARGGTGKDATGLANGQILIGNTVNTGFDLTTIAQSAPVIVTNDKGSITLSHARSGVTAATLGGSDRVIGYTVDANGHITATTNVAIALLDAGVIATGTLVVARGGTGQSAYTNGQILIGNTGSTGLDKSTIAQTTPIIVTNTQGLINLSHASTTVVAGTYGGSNRVIGYTVDQFGHITTASNVAIDQLPAAAITTGILTVARGGTGKDATGLTNGQILIANTVNTGFDLAGITQTAPVIVSTDKGSIRLSHARSGVTATSYGSASLIPVITVDDNGHITSATTAAASGLPAATANGQVLIGNTVSGSFDVALIAQTAPVIVTNDKGSIRLSHARSGATAGSYGSGTVVPVLTVDDNGHITVASTAAITGTGAIIKQNTISIGATAVESISWVVTDAAVAAGSFITGSIAYIAQTGKELDEMEMDQIDLKFAPASGSFTVYATGLSGMISGNFTFNYTIY